MAAAGLREELTCAVCLGLYQDPVALPCQHSFCAKCIGDAWDHSVIRFGVNCPQCRRCFNPRPSLVKNHTLQNIVEKYSRSQPTAPAARPSPVMCDNCIDSPSPAVKTCLKCETSFCSHHLQPHLTKQVYKDHGLIEPIADFTTRQCPTHKKIIEFYCEQDQECVCMSCTVIGKHKSHSLLTLEQAKDKIKGKLQSEVKNLREHQADCTRKQLSLKQQESEIKRHIKEMKEKLSTEFSGWRKQLEEDEKTVLKMIDDEEHRVLSCIKSESDSLVEKMDKLQLIDKECQDQDQKDAFSFIQDVKQLLARYTVYGYNRVFQYSAVNTNPIQSDDDDANADDADDDDGDGDDGDADDGDADEADAMAAAADDDTAAVADADDILLPPARNTTSQDVHVDLSTITSSIQMKMNEYQKYQRSILETIEEKSRQLH
ncbi:E3 ubiquitin/ISG15 ligase TRIM25-like isoform X6 [Amblyraja radiata]|uniref:E3 ubiquitin/ISG15 ligase TRIM25-like isoform X6 n=1 Tax=Amblyraja radiata TaxID=386614 RepID=UPI001402D6E5|nr:E3 ubiquitin/ISG15 ligase TRIM25-like isoform X6 [Amblyraja radiata]